MMGPLILIVLGVMFLLSNIFPQTFSFGRLWPVILIVIGVVKIVESLQKQKQVNLPCHKKYRRHRPNRLSKILKAAIQ